MMVNARGVIPMMLAVGWQRFFQVGEFPNELNSARYMKNSEDAK